MAKRLKQKKRSDRQRHAGASQSPPKAHALSLSRESRAAEGHALLERLDGMAGLRNGLRRASKAQDRYSGIPMPLDGEQLVIEPSYPGAEMLMAIGAITQREIDDGEVVAGRQVRNQFWSAHKRSHIVIFERDGKIDWGLIPGVHHLDHDLRTLGCSDAWGIEQESNALQLLATLLPHHAYKKYLLTGMFLERSKRSGVMYLFRKLKPTVAIAFEGDNETRILCALCQHPVAYYANSWAGAMAPTDDVIAALMLMRGDEHFFWKRATQHPAWVPQAGL